MTAPAVPTQGSRFEKITITSADGSKTVDLKQGVAAFQYFENLYSPALTATMRVVNTGQTINGRGVYNGLPIRGGEKVEIHLTTPFEIHKEETPGVFEITLYVNSVQDYVQEKQDETFILNLISKEGLINFNKRIIKKYTAKRIDEIIKDFLDIVECEEIDGELEKTINTYSFVGNMRKPFTLAPMLGVRGIPEGANKKSAGFFLWQTRKGMRFRSVETLTQTEEFAQEYAFDRKNEGVENPESSFSKILEYGVENNNNITGAQTRGEYSTYRIYFNPNTLKFTMPNESIFNASDKPQATLGTEENKPPEIVDPKKIPSPEMSHRIVSGVYSVGTLEPSAVGVAATAINMDQTEDVSQTISRFTSIFTQIITMTVPINVALCAGDIVKCLFPQVSTEDAVDDSQSGLYIIKEIIHYVSGNRSYSAMKVIRDTSGLK